MASIHRKAARSAWSGANSEEQKRKTERSEKEKRKDHATVDIAVLGDFFYEGIGGNGKGRVGRTGHDIAYAFHNSPSAVGETDEE